MDAQDTPEAGDELKHQQSLQSAQGIRSRSNTATSGNARRRPVSRASTTSVRSVSTQPSRPRLSEQTELPQAQQQAHQQTASRYSPERMLMQSAQQLTNPHGFPLDPSLESSVHDSLSYPSAAFRNGTPGLDQNAGEYQFDDGDSQMLDNLNEGALENVNGPTEAKGGKPGKKHSGSSAQNELELKRLFRENSNRSLHDVAEQLHVDERGPQSERVRQIFAMVWLNSACKKSTGSVPRGRVYSHYVSRRLGMRGESKYHYCGLSLHEDQPHLPPPHLDKKDSTRGSQFPTSNHSTPDLSQHPQLPADSAVFPASNMILDSGKPEHRDGPKRTSTSLFCDTSARPTSPSGDESSSGMIERVLRFSPATDSAFRENDPIDLPNINLYTPPGTDPDTAAALTALYRSNCTSLIDAMRYCRQKSFFHLFTSFHGTLTVPVQKLLTNPAMAPWIKECDFLMYQKMIHVMAPLALQVIPKKVIDTLYAVSKELVPHIRSSFSSHPPHVLRAKLGPATVFASLIDRLLRVNMAAHAAASILCNNATRDQMYEEWTRHVDPYRVVQNELPNCGYSEVLKILGGEVRELLEPVNVSWELPEGGDRHPSHEGSPGASTEGLLDRWASFVLALPNRFPRADVRSILTCVNSVATAALRDITMGSGKSFGAWWICKMWIDEMMGWMAEKGGFMEHTAPKSFEERRDTVADNVSDGYSHGQSHHSSHGSHPQSRFSSVGADFRNPSVAADLDSAARFGDLHPSMSFQNPFENNNDTQANTQRYNSAGSTNPSLEAAKKAALAAASGFGKDVGPDDSGVGMQDDLSMVERFNFETGEGAVRADSATANGDVAVC
ncbi:MAG: hypothetical protein M4579_000492 [Chaenotheca gracillima]|nr:MAG: hypothetical protein M4579_000492 [Chaenotheca gracillima]